MKNQPLVALIITVSSWLGNITLTGLAFFLAFKQSAPLTPATFLTLAICILLGNALPLMAYLIQLWWRQTELRAESMEADLTLRGAIMRSESLADRLDELSDATAKGVLLAKQIPEKVRERTQKLELLLTNLEDGDLEASLERLEKLTTQDLEKINEQVETLLKQIAQIETKLPEIETQLVEQMTSLSADFKKRDRSSNKQALETLAQIEKLSEKIETLSGFQNQQEVADPLMEEIESEDVGQVDESEGTQWAEDFLEEEAEGMVSQEESPEADSDLEDVDEANSAVKEFNSAEPPAEEASIEKSVEDSEVEDLTLVGADSGPVDFPIELDDEDNEADNTELAEEENVSLQTKDSQSEMNLEEDVVHEKSKGESTQIYVQAIVGISNKIYLRGDEPYLNWEKGTPLELVGIGEYRWKPEVELDKPIKLKLILNDKDWAEGENLTLNPGQTLRLNPKF